MHTTSWFGSLKECPLRILILHGRIILKWILKKQSQSEWTGLDWVRIGTLAGLLWTRERNRWKRRKRRTVRDLKVHQKTVPPPVSRHSNCAICNNASKNIWQASKLSFITYYSNGMLVERYGVSWRHCVHYTVFLLLLAGRRASGLEASKVQAIKPSRTDC
jgi:hypothetical protein